MTHKPVHVNKHARHVTRQFLFGSRLSGKRAQNALWRGAGKHPSIREWQDYLNHVYALDDMGALQVFKLKTWNSGGAAEYYFQPGDETGDALKEGGGLENVGRYLHTSGLFDSEK